MAERKKIKEYNLCIIGGTGHVGLPLGIVMANSGVKTVLFDINKEMLKKIKAASLLRKKRLSYRAIGKRLGVDHGYVRRLVLFEGKNK